MKQKIFSAGLIAILIAGTLNSCKKSFEDNEFSYDPNSVSNSTVDANTEQKVDDVAAEISKDESSDYEFNTATANKIIGKSSTVAVEGTGASVDGTTATITKSGDYIVEGTLNDGKIVVAVSDDDNGTVKLIFNNANFTSKSSAALYIDKAKKVSVLLKENTVNTFVSESVSDTSAAIQSDQDLFFSGEGSLKVTSDNYHGIKCTDGMVFKSGTYDISAINNDGIQAKSYLKIEGGKYKIKAAQHTLKSTSEKENKGFIYITGGEFDLTSIQKDGIHGMGTVQIKDGTFKISAVSDGIYSSSHVTLQGGTFVIANTNKCISALGDITIDGGDYTLTPVATKSGESGEGHGITVKKNGTYRTGNVNINGGKINITQSYEGIQGVIININGGEVYVNSLDDAINASNGANSQPGFQGRPGAPGAPGSTTTTSTVALNFNGGFVYCKAQGDGVDSNGELNINDGVVLVSQWGQANEPMDAGDGYEPKISGGVVIAVGQSGMASAPSCTQTSLFTSVSGNANTYIAINDADNNNIMAWKVPQNYQIATLSAPDFKSGKYQVFSTSTVEGDEYIKGSGFYYPAKTCTGSGTTVTLSEGKCTSTSNGGGMGGRPGW